MVPRKVGQVRSTGTLPGRALSAVQSHSTGIFHPVLEHRNAFHHGPRFPFDFTHAVLLGLQRPTRAIHILTTAPCISTSALIDVWSTLCVLTIREHGHGRIRCRTACLHQARLIYPSVLTGLLCGPTHERDWASVLDVRFGNVE